MSSHKQILKSSGIVGGAQVVNIIIGIIRSKVIAVLLGPAGVGFAGMLTATTSIIGSITSLGIGSSAVRNIAEASGSGDASRIAKTVKILRRLVWATGLLGMGVTILFCRPLSRMTFNTTDHALEIALLSITLILTAISAGQTALLQGLRRIRQMALAGIIGSVLGLLTTFPLYWWLGIKGVVPALVLSSVTMLYLSWLFARQVKTLPVEVSYRETLYEGWSMVKLGVCMTSSALMGTGTMYLVRLWISHHQDLNAVGQFQAAWGISATYLGIILGAMGADFYPRLTSFNKENTTMSRLVNEQLEVALLLSGPLIIFMILFMRFIVILLYSDKFPYTVEILRWQIMGDLFKVVAWCLGFILLAKGAGFLIIVTELAWNFVYLILTIILWKHYGLLSTGISFYISFFFSLILCYGCAKWKIGFIFESRVVCLFVIYFISIIFAYFNSRLFAGPWCYLSGGFLVFALSLHSFYNIFFKIFDGRSFLRSKIKMKNHEIIGNNYAD